MAITYPGSIEVLHCSDILASSSKADWSAKIGFGEVEACFFGTIDLVVVAAIENVNAVDDFVNCVSCIFCKTSCPTQFPTPN